MAKIYLTTQTRSPNRRKPGFALLRVTGWPHSPEQTEMAIQRQSDEKHLGTGGEWEPTPVWQLLEKMVVCDDGALEGDVGPALVDPIVNALNDSYRAILKCNSITEMCTLRKDGGLLASSASGSAPDSAIFTKDFILSDFEDVFPADNKKNEFHAENFEQPQLKQIDFGPVNSGHESHQQSLLTFFARNKTGFTRLLLVLLVGFVLSVAWSNKWFPPEVPDFIPEPEPTVGEKAEPGFENSKLSDLQVLQQFMETQPTTETILEKAEEWSQTKRCEAMLRLLVHSGHKSEDARIALTYAKLYDPNLFQAGNCIDEADKDTAIYWYQKAAETGSNEAIKLLENLK